MLTLEQAQALQPGSKVEVGFEHNGQWRWIGEWIVYAPTPEHRFDNDDTIVKYIYASGSGVRSYIFSDQLHRYRLASGWKEASNEQRF